LACSRLFTEPFTADNSALVLVDHQTGTLAIVDDQPREQLRGAVVGIARAARVLGVPVVLTSASTSFIGPTLHELSQVLEGIPNIEPTTLSAWDYQRIRGVVKETVPAADDGMRLIRGSTYPASELMRRATERSPSRWPGSPGVTAGRLPWPGSRVADWRRECGVDVAGAGRRCRAGSHCER
jgi:hypothetical protein